MKDHLKGVLVLAMAFFALLMLGGCLPFTPGLVPGIGGKTKIEREFADADSHYSESIVAPAGVDASKLSKFTLKLKDGNGMEYEVGVDASDDFTTQGQAAMLGQISSDSVAALQSAFATIEALAPGLGDLIKALAAKETPPVEEVE